MILRTRARRLASNASAAMEALALPNAARSGTWTLERILERSRAANAHLPIARTEVESGAESAREARAGLVPRLSVGAMSGTHRSRRPIIPQCSPSTKGASS